MSKYTTRNHAVDEDSNHSLEIDIHPALLQSLTVRAASMNMSISELLEKAVVEWLSHESENISSLKSRDRLKLALLVDPHLMF